jgi:hypothetical protein
LEAALLPSLIFDTPQVILEHCLSVLKRCEQSLRRDRASTAHLLPRDKSVQSVNRAAPFGDVTLCQGVTLVQRAHSVKVRLSRYEVYEKRQLDEAYLKRRETTNHAKSIIVQDIIGRNIA